MKPDEEKVARTLVRLRALDGRFRALGVADEKRLSSLRVHLADMAEAAEEILAAIESLLAAGDTERATDAIASLSVETMHMTSHIRCVKKDLSWLADFLDRS